MRHCFYTVLLFFCGCAVRAQSGSLPPLGQWRVHLSYQSLVTLTTNGQDLAAFGPAGGFVYAPASGNYQYFNTQNGLGQTGIRFAQWDKDNQQWVLAYDNGSIDLVKGSQVVSLSDFKRFSTNGNKTIYGLNVQNGRAYLATGLGLAVLRLSTPFAWDLWFPVAAGATPQINGHVENNAFHYVAATAGLFRSRKTANGNASTTWENMGGQRGLPTGASTQVLLWNNRVVAQVGQQLWAFNDSTNWTPLLADTSWQTLSCTSNNTALLVTQEKNNNSRVLVLSASGNQQQVFSSPQRWPALQQAVSTDPQNIWLIDRETGLWQASPAIENMSPNGPLGVVTGDAVLAGNALVFASGNPQPNGLPPNRNGLQFFDQDSWSFHNYRNSPLLDTVFNWTSLAFARADSSFWAGTQADGLVWKKGPQTLVFDARNSGLTNNSTGACGVPGVWVDAQNQVWASNAGNNQPLKMRQPNGQWQGFRPPFSLPATGLGKLMGDAQGNLWATVPGLGVLAYHPGNNSSSAADDRWKLFQPGSGQGNLPDPQVLSLVSDKDGSIWLGTADGLALVVCNEELYQGNRCDAILPVVQQGSFTGRLLQQENVLSLAVDGANRKWAGTRNGVFLLSPDGKKVLEHFTTQNSPLLHNTVLQIGIVPATGEVFFATPAGTCSYRSRATDAAANSSVTVFPNPVPPGYAGWIGIRGLPENAWVKITELNGRLVAQTRSLGGQASWDGRDASGKPVAAGVYLVLARDSEGKEKIATKIVKASQ